MTKHKTEKGSGGKRGHSNQDNWMTHQEEKDLGRKARRLEGRDLEQEALSGRTDEANLVPD